jgi:hypothetical protein
MSLNINGISACIIDTMNEHAMEEECINMIICEFNVCFTCVDSVIYRIRHHTNWMGAAGAE